MNMSVCERRTCLQFHVKIYVHNPVKTAVTSMVIHQGQFYLSERNSSVFAGVCTELVIAADVGSWADSCSNCFVSPVTHILNTNSSQTTNSIQIMPSTRKKATFLFANYTLYYAPIWFKLASFFSLPSANSSFKGAGWENEAVWEGFLSWHLCSYAISYIQIGKLAQEGVAHLLFIKKWE